MLYSKILITEIMSTEINVYIVDLGLLGCLWVKYVNT